MKNKILVSLFLFWISASSQSFVNVLKETIVVNSVTSLSGWSRNKVEIDFPKNTIGYVYRLTAFPRNKVSMVDALFDVLKNVPISEVKIDASIAKFVVDNSNGSAIDYYIFTNPDDANAFYKKENNNWSSCKSFPNVISTCRSENGCLNTTIYFGFRNNNLSEGLDVHLEVVAIVDESITASSQYGFKIENQAGKDINFELSLNGKNWSSYSLKANYYEDFTFNQEYAFFKIFTTDKGFVEYKIQSSEKYKIIWNALKGIWDLNKY